MPSVSQKRRRSAPSSLAAWPKRSRNSRSAREASSALTETYTSCSLAKATQSRIWSSTHWRDFGSLCSMWMSLADMEMATASTPQSRECWMSATTARFQARIEGLRPSSTICVMACFSSPQHGRDADLDLVHADLVKQLGDADLLVVGEHHAGGLLAVAQGGVVDAHRRALGRRLFGDDEAREIARFEVSHARTPGSPSDGPRAVTGTAPYASGGMRQAAPRRRAPCERA